MILYAVIVFQTMLNIFLLLCLGCRSNKQSWVDQPSTSNRSNRSNKSDDSDSRDYLNDPGFWDDDSSSE